MVAMMDILGGVGGVNVNQQWVERKGGAGAAMGRLQVGDEDGTSEKWRRLCIWESRAIE